MIHRVIRNEKRSVVLISQVGENYFSSSAPPSSEAKRFTLTFATRIVSSVYSDAPPLVNLSRLIDNPTTPDATSILSSLQSISPSLALSFFPALLNSLCQLIGSEDPGIARHAVEALFAVMARTREGSQEKHSTCNLQLLFYVRYMLDSFNSAVPLHENLTKHWLGLLLERKSTTYEALEKGEVWIVLDVVLKSMIMKLCSRPIQRNSRIKAFSSEFTSDLKSLCLKLFCTSRDFQHMDILTMVPMFMKDLLGLIDRGVVFEMVCFTPSSVPHYSSSYRHTDLSVYCLAEFR